MDLTTLRWRFWRRLALLTSNWEEVVSGVVGRFHRRFAWRAMQAHAALKVRARKQAGCVPGCTKEPFPHNGPCFTLEMFIKKEE